MADRALYTAIDANLNRALEGMRVCEDVMRFYLRRDDYSGRLKALRHSVADAARLFPADLLLEGRDVAADVQKFIDLPGEKSRGSIGSLFKANLHRAMEAVRSLEEFGKLVCPDMNDNPFQRIRFSLYELEPEAMSALARQDKTARFSSALYAILDTAYIKMESLDDAAAKMIRGGATIIQLRMKSESREDVLTVARDIALLCREGKALFIVNDHVDVAMLAGADGVHLGLNDLRANEARKIVPPGMIIGITAYTREDPSRAAGEGADYIAVGPVYDTVYVSGSGSVTLRGSGVEVISRARDAVNVPVVAIGGITPEGAGAAVSAGADAVAVTSYLYKDGKIEENCRKILEAISSGSTAK
ncbi:MAG: thiamine phosphate synthase [Spirochaetes bacterium]|nr:thiamine phosphate synthase [Spirochaetota bacterium]